MYVYTYVKDAMPLKHSQVTICFPLEYHPVDYVHRDVQGLPFEAIDRSLYLIDRLNTRRNRFFDRPLTGASPRESSVV